MATPIVSDDLWQRLERLSPNQRRTAMSSSPGESRVNHDEFSRAFYSCFAQVFRGAGYRLPRTFRPARPAYATFGGGIARESGNAFLKRCSPNCRRPTRSIGIGPWWIARRCGLRVAGRKLAQIPRIGASWEASIISSPMAMAFHWRSP